MTTHTIPRALDDVIEQLVANDAPWEIKDGFGASVRVSLGGNYYARLTADDGTVTVAFTEGWGILGETRFSHAAPAQAFLVAAHIASLADVAEVLAP